MIIINIPIGPGVTVAQLRPVFNEVMGKDARAPEESRRIVSLSPVIMETLFFLGLATILLDQHILRLPSGSKKQGKGG